LFSETTIAQKNNVRTDNQIALQYYRDGKFTKAAEVYKRLYNYSRSSSYYRYLINCYISLKQYDNAINLTKTHFKYNKNDLTVLVDLGYVYSLEGNENKAKSTYQSAVKKIKPDRHQIIQLANAFLVKHQYEFAEQTYIEGEKILKGAYGFQIEKGQLYYYMRSYDKMISEYLNVLAISSRYLQTIQNRLQHAVYNDIDASLKQKLKDQLLQRINKNPDLTVYNELLIWLYIQDKDFENAFIQARALDMRFNENGKRIIALARVAAENNNFNVAVDAYKYVIEKGNYLEYYYAARNEMLEVMYKRIILGIDNTYEDYLQMEKAFINALQEMGINFNTIDLIANLAHLQAFYLDKTGDAIFLLEDAITIRGLNYKQKGKLELELADVYLISGEVWDATLAYAKVEEKNKNNPIGFDAKFRKARLAYYIGNFEWAQAQLDVLKASTSKLIANDAAHLAFFIYENTGWDSVETAMQMYARADFLFYRSKDSLAVLTLDSLITLFPNHEVIDEAWFLKGNIYRHIHKYNKAIKSYQVIIDKYYDDVLADNALFVVADIYENALNNNEKAMELYKKLILDFPDSIYKLESRLRYRKLRGDKVIN
jgi:tetratricopeptide (TPR) repeat protein